jgi:hypothetical protein
MPFGNGLGNKYDLGTGVAPVDLASGAATGTRVYMAHCDAVDVVFIKGAGTASEDPVLTLKQHTAASGGTTSDLEVITKYFTKGEATLDNDEVWTETSQAASAEVTTVAEEEQIVVFTVSKDQLAEGSKYISVDIASIGAEADAQLGTVLYIFHGLDRHASPTSYLNPLTR